MVYRVSVLPAYLAMLLCAFSARAWQCEVHLALTDRSVSGLPYYDHANMCGTYPARHANVTAQYQPYRQCSDNYQAGFLLDGSYYPDSGPRNDPFPGRNAGNALGHLYDADGHANTALRSAIRQCHNRLPCGRGGAFWNLGNSLHYVQDHGDPSKWVDNIFHRDSVGNRKSYVRRIADDYLHHRIPVWMSQYVAAYQREAQSIIDSLNYADNSNAILAELGRIRDRSVGLMKQAFEAYENDPYYFDDQAMNRVVLRETVISIEAISLAGRRWYDIYSHQCSQQPDHRIVECDETARQGADTPETIQINVINRRRINFWYDTHSKKDRIRVWYGSEPLLDTGCVGQSRSQDFHLSGYASHITVSVEPNCDGGSNTRWDFKVSCQ